MYNIEEVHCSAAIHAVLQANLQLMDATIEEALQSIAYGKTDTLGLDGIPESAIANSLRNFDRGALLITEEIGAMGAAFFRRHGRHYPPTFYLSDPTDRSAQLREFLSSHDPGQKIGDVLLQEGVMADWETRFGQPSSISGASSAITCIRYGVPIAAAIVNFITQELFVASRSGVFRFQLPHYTGLDPSQISPEHVRSNGEAVFFRPFEQTGAGMERMRYFVTFLGKSGYRENFCDSDLIRSEHVSKYLRYDHPGGPSRVLHLSTIQPTTYPVGFVLANGEKIGEWIHWIPFVRFGKTEGEPTRHALSVYEIHQERPWTKDGILMSTPPPYSIFSGFEEDDGKMIVDIDKLQSFSNPSRIRSTLLVTSTTNTWAITVMSRHLYREIEFADKR